MVQRRAARFISQDYKDRTPGCVSNMLAKSKLPSLAKRRRHHRLTFLFKISKGLIPSMPEKDFLVRTKTGRRRIKPTRYGDSEISRIVRNTVRNNTLSYDPIFAKTTQYEHSFFPKTVAEWNKLDEDTVRKGLCGQLLCCLTRRQYGSGLKLCSPPPVICQRLGFCQRRNITGPTSQRDADAESL